MAIILFSKPNHNDYYDSTLYKYISNLFPNCRRINIVCQLTSGLRGTIALPENISVSLMIKLIVIFFDLRVKNIFLVYNGMPLRLNLNGDKKIKNIFGIQDQAVVDVCDTVNLISGDNFKGKKLRVSMFFKNLGIFKFKDVFRYSPIGSLYYSDWEDKINKIYYNGKLLKKDDSNSLASLGINDDFGCIVE